MVNLCNKRIAFGYKRRVGKDTSCDYLMSKYGGVKLSFAEPLYEILYFAQNVCGFKKTKDRKFLQFIGTEWARTINDNVWVDLLKEKIKQNNNHNIYISDVRFKNEFKALKDHGFTCIQINGSRDQEDGYCNHSSDKDLDDFNEWDFTIDNFSTIENLYDQIDHIYKKI